MDHCMTHDLWMTLNAKMYEYLASVSLRDLVTQHAQKYGIHVTAPISRHSMPAHGSTRTAARSRLVVSA